MPRRTHPRNNPLTVQHDDHILIGYEVVLGDPDQAFAHWLVAQADGSLLRVRVEDTSPSATAFTNRVFNSTKDLIGEAETEGD